MINWAGKQAPEDRQATEGRIGHVTQYGVGEPREKHLSSLRTSKSNRDNLELLQAVTMLREGGHWGGPRDPETKGASAEPREDVHLEHVLQGMQPRRRCAL